MSKANAKIEQLDEWIKRKLKSYIWKSVKRSKLEKEKLDLLRELIKGLLQQMFV